MYLDMLSSGIRLSDWMEMVAKSEKSEAGGGRGRGAGEAESNCAVRRGLTHACVLSETARAPSVRQRGSRKCAFGFLRCRVRVAGSGERDVHLVCIILSSSVSLGSMARMVGTALHPDFSDLTFSSFLHAPLFDFRVQLKPHLDDQIKTPTRDQAQSRRGC